MIGFVDEIEQSILDVGWNPDSVLLVADASEAQRKAANDPDLMDVHDGNTRLRAVMRVNAVTQLPCRIITMPTGIKYIYLTSIALK